MVLSNNIEQTKITLGICNVCAIKQFETQKKKKKNEQSRSNAFFFSENKFWIFSSPSVSFARGKPLSEHFQRGTLLSSLLCSRSGMRVALLSGRFGNEIASIIKLI